MWSPAFQKPGVGRNGKTDINIRQNECYDGSTECCGSKEEGVIEVKRALEDL